ncbi:NADH-quinone oxidoreductase subunit J [Arcanobacterium pinnipediorum]|uniref:NADH-quinone oxidoreductase subunit J n=1 Tax=Arcanobacterium pinnipediorum TaxID=1503041 RepID=A0ABY5AHT8_9ACTO|nr:NADH-quinone oxidoreductase subunit J [Arcanobacterium pinnipediorum]USR79657.1 NADH-quinone oxidoreductase subunit J [Arcanobacterium pinnipediorum]
MPNEPLMTLSIGTGEMILFAVTSVCMIALAIFGLLITRKAVLTTLSVIGVMVGLAVLYTALEAPFMGVVQVVVYTGAILMMFLFVLMLIGVDSADSGHETLKVQRPVAVLGGLGIAAILIGVAFGAHAPQGVGLELANSESNPVGVATLIFSSSVLTLQLTGTLLIVAALGAMTLTHRDRVKERITQEELAHQRMQQFTSAGVHVGQKPPPGVFAESNSSANPALTVGGQPLEDSTSRVLHIRGQVRTVAEISPTTVQRVIDGGIHGPSTYGVTGWAQIPGMPGESAPDHEQALARLGSAETPMTAPGTDEIPDQETVQREHDITEANTEKSEEN